MSRCSEKSSLNVVQATICSVQSQSLGDFPWFTALTDSITALDDYHIIPPDQHIDFKQAQELDPVISGVVHFLQSGKRPSVRESGGEFRELHRLLFESNKLILGTTLYCIVKRAPTNRLHYPGNFVGSFLRDCMGTWGTWVLEECFIWQKQGFTGPT